KGPLHRMQAAIARKPFDGGDCAAFGAERRDQAAMDGLAVDQHAAGAAVAGIAAFLDAEMPELAQKGPQALSRARPLCKRLAVDLKAHGASTSSQRISSASRSVMCLRQKGLPWKSS